MTPPLTHLTRDARLSASGGGDGAPALPPSAGRDPEPERLNRSKGRGFRRRRRAVLLLLGVLATLEHAVLGDQSAASCQLYFGRRRPLVATPPALVALLVPCRARARRPQLPIFIVALPPTGKSSRAID